MSPLRAGLMCLAMAGVGCGGDTYCQSGAKHGTQCYSMTDVRTPPGQRPPISSEPPPWYAQPPPPSTFGSGANPPPPPIAVKAPSWLPAPDAGAIGAGRSTPADAGAE